MMNISVTGVKVHTRPWVLSFLSAALHEQRMRAAPEGMYVCAAAKGALSELEVNC